MQTVKLYRVSYQRWSGADKKDLLIAAAKVEQAIEKARRWLNKQREGSAVLGDVSEVMSAIVVEKN
jgi:hypothetical protein